MMASSRFSRRVGVWVGAMTLLLVLVACPADEGTQPVPQAPRANATIGTVRMGNTTVFRVTVNSVQHLTGATSFNLIGDDTEPAAQTRQTFGNQAENYVVNRTTIGLEIYNAGGQILAETELNANDYAGGFSGNITLERASGQAVGGARLFVPEPVGLTPLRAPRAVQPQVNQLDVLARGVLEDLDTFGTFRRQVTLYCSQLTGPFTPDPSDGFFIINDVAIEFNYAFDQPTEFNDVFTIKFIESDRNFDNMGLYFRLPGRTRIINARTGQALSSSDANAVLDAVQTYVNQAAPLAIATAEVELTIGAFGPSNLVETTVISVTGDCVLNARSFTVQEGSGQPEPPQNIGDRLDKNSLENSLVLLILGEEVDQRDQELTVCDQWSVAQSGGYGTTVDDWDISTIPTGATFDLRFDAYSVPDKFIVEYPAGTVRFDTGWRGDRWYDGRPEYPGGVTSPGSGQEEDMFTKAAVNSFRVTVIGVEQGTLWQYSVRCRIPD